MSSPEGPAVGSDRQAALAVALSLATVAIAGAGLATADPPDDLDHGVNETTFPLLWSGDEDGNLSSEGSGDNEAIAIRQLASGTDIPFNSPPPDVERWNDGELDEFPSTNRSVSIRPTSANIESGRFVKDAHATMFAIQPSTRARLSSASQPLYVASNGTVLGTVDYRVELPADDTGGSRQVYWTLEEHRIEETRLLVDGDEAATGGGSHITRLSFEDADAGSHSLTLAATVSVRVEEHVRTETEVCEEDGNETTCHTEVSHEYNHHNETVTVTDQLDVETYDLDVSGRYVEYPDGDTGIALTADRPWLGLSLPQGTVTGTWRFYSARDTGWDQLVYSTENRTSRRHSSLHPLQVNAFPVETGASASQPNATVLATDGERRTAPELPDNVNLDVADGSYTGSETVVTRVSGDVATVRARGLVRGVGTRVPVEDLNRIEVHRSNLTLSVVNGSGTNTSVRVTLRDEATGAPINTASRDGYVVLEGERVNTTNNGTASVSLDAPGAMVTARYEPGGWWHDTPGYQGDSQTVTVGGPSLQLVATLFRFVVPVGLFLLAVYFVDRVTRWQIWPPWRGLYASNFVVSGMTSMSTRKTLCDARLRAWSSSSRSPVSR